MNVPEPIKEYIEERDKRTEEYREDIELLSAARNMLMEMHRVNYVKNFTWMGQPIIQFPTDLVVMQELIREQKPDCIVEVGVAFGGMTLFYAEMLEMLGHGMVVAVDKEVRPHNRNRIMDSRVAGRIMIVEGDSSNLFTAKEVFRHIPYGAKVLVSLDSNHTASHVKMELDLYSTLIQPGGYLVVFDTVIEMVMKEKPADRPWGPGNNPYQAVGRWLAGHPEWVPDHNLTARALITAAPGGWLRRIR